jgi:hypothetical protein
LPATRLDRALVSVREAWTVILRTFAEHSFG